MPGTDRARQRLQLIERLLHVPEAHLDDLERFLGSLHTTQEVQRATSTAVPADPRDWPHAPLHRISEEGTYIVTASTLDKVHHFRGSQRLDYLQAELLSHLAQRSWHLEAWAVFSNHYHFVAHAQPASTPLPDLLKELHRSTALYINQLDQAPGRQVWFQYWETELTFETSYLARLNYVHQNAVKNGLVGVANQYRWCSAAWFEWSASQAQVKTIYGLKIDRVHVEDNFDPV